ncbi:cytochrome P450 [Stachybotrys elegans]|uniref:Cytochrome P450 n=1 Tax=Stachybotrys elegans TaxID=80388 RepID=A0A8K0SD32_9HYPO|nr:cytochrome P450 [Stachybotrys elegans]
MAKCKLDTSVCSDTDNCRVLRNPRDVKTVFKDSDKHTKAVNNNAGWLMSELLGQCMGLISGGEYRRARDATTPAFSHKSALSYLSRISAITKEHMKALSGRLDNRIHPVADLRFLPFWIMVDIIYGRISSTLRKELESLVVLRESLWGRMIQGGSTRYSWAQYLPTSTARDLRDFKTRWERFNDEAHDSCGESDATIVSMYAEMKKGSITRQGLLQTIDEMLFANLDVSMGGISWTLMFLASHSKVQDEVRQEAREARISRKSTSWDDYLQSSTTMLAACILEAGRLKPLAAFSVPQSAPTNRVVSGFLVPAGTNFIVDTHALNISNPFWGEDRDQYRPARFLEKKTSDMRYQYWRFGFGPRQCLGKYFVELLIRVLVTELVENYRLGLMENTHWEKNATTWILHPDTELRCESLKVKI